MCTQRIVIEGLPGAGKTTQIRAMAEELQCPVVPEWVGFSPKQWMSYELVQPFHKCNDEAKDFLAQKLQEPLVLVDRHYTGTLAYAYALTKIEGAQGTRPQSYNDQLNWYLSARASGRLHLPDLCIILDIDPNTSFQRQPLASLGGGMWGRIDALQYMIEYYNLFYLLLEPSVPVVHISSMQSHDEVYRCLRSVIKTYCSI